MDPRFRNRFGNPYGFSLAANSSMTMTDFAFETDVQVRYSDLDTLGHVNNARIATFLEEGRVDYFAEGLGHPLEDRSMLIATLSIDFEAPVKSRVVTVGLGITRIGESSFDFEYAVEADERTVATAESVQVAYDLTREEKIPFPDDWRAAVLDLEDEVELPD